jgi:oligopeptide/dipeptide ABC transporter ATP-binding protein
MSAVLEVQNLVRQFPTGSGGSWPWQKERRPMLHAVDHVSFDVQKGETVGLVGESGSGKSTLVRLATRALDPTSGSIRFQGEDIGKIPASGFGRTPWRSKIQMVFQDAEGSLNPRFTSFDAIADPLRRLKSLSGAALTARVKEVASLCGLPEALLQRFPHQLSGGQKARVGIARAIAVEPELLILDEPTAALDVSVQVVILQLLDELKKRLGMSYIFVTHDLNVVRLICDRVLVLYLGKVVEAGPARQVFEHPAHPYTNALLSAIPPMPGETVPDRIRLQGDPRSPIDPDPNICRFYGRCPSGVDRCRTQMPALARTAPGRVASCHFPLLDKAA